MNAITEIVNQFLTQLASEMRAHLKHPDGTTGKLFEVSITEKGDDLSTTIQGNLLAPSYVENLEHGRGPTVNTQPSTPTLQQAILQWVKANSFSFPLAPKTTYGHAIKNAEALSWAIAIKIHNEGMKAPAPGILSDVLTQDRIEAFMKVFESSVNKIIFQQLIKDFQQ